METILAPCSHCLRETRHAILFTHKMARSEHWEGTFHFFQLYRLLECAGCGAVCMQDYYPGPFTNYPPIVAYYPSPVSRRRPEWVSYLPQHNSESDPFALVRLFDEVYAAITGGQHRLAAMGIRALLEQTMISKTGDHGTFSKNIEAFYQGGFVSTVQRNAMIKILDIGHAVIHRLHDPSPEDLNTALDITEGILAAIYVHGTEAERAAERVPKRGKPEKKP